METDVAGIFAAGDIARFPYALPGSGSVRVEHWVVAEQQGQVAAANMLGARKRYDHAPFFWSQHYDLPINYVGHAGKWDMIEVIGDLKARDALVKYRRDGRGLAEVIGQTEVAGRIQDRYSGFGASADIILSQPDKYS